jgi:hypothetical protein
MNEPHSIIAQMGSIGPGLLYELRLEQIYNDLSEVVLLERYSPLTGSPMYLIVKVASPGPCYVGASVAVQA